MNEILWTEQLPGNSTWSHRLRRGTALRITALEDGANVGLMLWNADDLTERMNLPDTLKAQHIARLTAGDVLYSDMGRVLCAITEDTVGWHDPLGGCSDAALVAASYGALSYQEGRNGWHQNALDGFLIEMAKHGMDARDLMMNVNLFSKVTVAEGGGMRYVPANARAGQAVELRAEMNVLIVLNTCQHPMETSGIYCETGVELTLKRVPPAADDDLCRVACVENGRGYTLTERYFA